MTTPPCSTDPEAMYPNRTDDKGIARAKAICAACPLTAACLQAAMDLEGERRDPADRHGIWGGKTPAERAKGWRKRAVETRPDRIAVNAAKLAPWLKSAEGMILAGMSMTAVAKATGVSAGGARHRLLRHRRDLYDHAMQKVSA